MKRIKWLIIYKKNHRMWKEQLIKFLARQDLYIYIGERQRWTSIKSTCKLSVCLSKNLRWLNEQFKRVLRSDTRPVSRLNNFQVWLQCWRYHCYLFTWLSLGNFDARHLCAYIISHRSDVSSVNAVEATVAVIYLCLSFSARFKFFNKTCLIWLF